MTNSQLVKGQKVIDIKLTFIALWGNGTFNEKYASLKCWYPVDLTIIRF